MKIRIDSHTLERAMERGTNEDEIIDVLHAGFDIPAKKVEEVKPEYSILKKTTRYIL